MTSILICLAVFVSVACLVALLANFTRGAGGNEIEDRLDLLTGVKSGGKSKDSVLMESVLQHPLDAVPGLFEAIVKRFRRFGILFEQADTALTPNKFFLISAGLGMAGAFFTALTPAPPLLIPFFAIGMALTPILWLMWRRKRRFKKFASQMPDALELISRALRAGHSLASGFNLVQEEMTAPLGVEFGRVFEEQNLGKTMEEALNSLADRIPNLDLKFFATAVILQRQTGGDLAEILDKIGYIVRERFKIWGQVQALTGEGRLSGIVLLALPPVLFLAVLKLNPTYVMMLFTDPMGRQMLAGAIVMQLLGAITIRKIVNIKV